MEQNKKVEKLRPQLAMKRELINIPEVKIPGLYELRTYIPGDEETWELIMKESFKHDVCFTELSNNEAFNPERILFICFKGQPVATACAWFRPKWGEETGYLHRVGVVPEHNGKGLGYWVSLAAITRMAKEGRKYAMLETDDFRIPAIKTYIKLGFKPLLVHENQIKRWTDLLTAIGREDMISQFEYADIYETDSPQVKD